jgi:hypothetical protein
MFGVSFRAFLGGKPATVGGFVIPIWVDAIKFVFAFWSFAHVREKISKILPAFTNRNSSTSIIVKPSVTSTSATVPHSPPGIVSWVPRSFFRMVMFAIAVDVGIDLFEIFKGRFFVDAPTTFRISLPQLLSGYDSLVSAFTLAYPLNLASFVWGSVYDEKPTEGFSDEIDGFGHLHHIGQKEEDFN